MIQKGRVKKSQSFDGLQHFDSGEGLHISLKFGNTEINFEADNSEEKYTICCLLGYILQTVQDGDDQSLDSPLDLPPLEVQQMDRTDVIKEGLLEKRGSGTITTWKKRKVKLLPGEFSYYKPGEVLVLNIIQLRQDVWEVKKLGNNGFTVRMKDRVYSFRVPSEYKIQHMIEIVRNEWILAFQQAFSQVPFTAKLFDQSTNESHTEDSVNESYFDDPEHIYDVTPDMNESIPIASAQDRVQVPLNCHSPGEITAHVTVHLNYIDKSSSVPVTVDSRWSSDNLLFFREDNNLNQDESYTELSFLDDPPTSGDPFTGSAAALRKRLEKQGGKSKSLKAYRAQHDFHEQQTKSSPESHMILKSYFSEIGTKQAKHQMMPGDAKKLSYDVDNSKSPLNKSNSSSTSETISVGTLSPISSKKPQKLPRRSHLPPPPLTPVNHIGSPPGAPLPPGSPPPLSSPLFKNSTKLTPNQNVKMKQVHWVKVNSNQIGTSMWKNACDVTGWLDLAELENHFSTHHDKKVIAAKPKPQENKEMLIDAKRAQNLGILFCGLKPEHISRLVDALNSATESEGFPADKMATLKRYQPTPEEKEMYKAQSSKCDSLHDVDHFMLKLCEIPSLSLRLDFTLTLWEFPDHYASLEEEVSDLLSGCDEILTSDDLISVLEYLLAIGNYMNAHGAGKHGVQGFQISSIDKILSVKGHDSQTTLCVYLVRQIKKNQPDLLDWSRNLGHVSKCQGYTIKAVGAEIEVLKNDLQKMKKILKTLRSQAGFEERTDKKFQVDVQNFIVEYDCKLQQLEVKYTEVTDKYKQLLVKFGEAANKTTESIFSYVSLLMDKFQQAAEKLKSEK